MVAEPGRQSRTATLVGGNDTSLVFFVIKKEPIVENVIKLSQPIELRSATTGQVVSSITELKLRAPNAGDMADALDEAGGNMKNTGTLIRTLACRCAGITRSQFDGLSMADGLRLIGEMTAFLGNGPATGLTLSPSSLEPSGSPMGGDNGKPESSASSLHVRLDGRPH